MQEELISPYVYAGIPATSLPKNIRKAIMKSNTMYLHKIIVDAIEEIMGINLIEMQSKYMFRHITKARNIYCYYMQAYTKWTLFDIGESIGGRHHTSVMDSIKVHHELFETDPEFKEKSLAIKNIIEWKSQISI